MVTGLDLIKKFEGLRLEAYLCPAGIPTIGYGHTEGVKLGQKITEAQANRMLADDYLKFESDISHYIKVPVKENQLDALVSFAFNLGVAALRNSTLLKKLNLMDYTGAAAEFDKWVYAKDPKTGARVVLSGLKRRRAAERSLFEGK